MDILVTGASNRLGPSLVEALRRDGDRLRLMSRRGTGPGGVRGDLATGFDLPDALAGAEVVVHAASDARNAWEVDVAGTRRLVQAVDRDRLRHLVYVSIVGVDRIPWSYYRAKYAAEQVLLASGLPVTLVRITQYFGFVDELLETARRGPVLPVPMGWRAQPVDVRDAAAYLARVARQPPTGGVVEFGGPEELAVADIARAWVAARESGGHVVSTPVPGRLSTAFRDGAALPSGGERGQRTYAAHLRG
ncbi:SDR family oxidoreductase [Blastococcus sp. TF02A-26]|uniref:SDR family oxidoreductase n=1 Tax=Blastococcus sp. TF02A-26 TaxID=2250577 RepID=UPI000DEB82A4|nr:NAD(P)H-binding protein [Blastococcus sp. TF02A-26]RBY88265.1 epimerase [Blastococcus sp. TF02A-26]